MADASAATLKVLEGTLVKLLVARELFEPEVAEGMLEWFHSSFSMHDGVRLDEEDQAAHERLAGSPRGPQAAWGALARYRARCPVSLERLEYDRESGTVTLHVRLAPVRL